MKFGNVEIVDDSKTIKPTELPKLTPFEIKQIDFLVKEYPMLDQAQIESVIRITDTQRDKIVQEIKDGDLKHEPLESEECVTQSVEVN